LGQESIGGLISFESRQKKFFDQTILQGLISALDTTLSLRRRGTDQFNPQFNYCAFKLRLGVCGGDIALIDPKNAETISIEGFW
jgi:hypothetical protein